MQEQQLGGRRTQQARLRSGLAGLGPRHVERVEPEGGVVVMEGVVEGARAFLVLA